MTPLPIPVPLVTRLRAAQRVAVLTGAGISAESGVPTFREAQTGLWARYRPEELATPEAFRHDPRRVWEWYAWRRERVQQTAPNPGHLALVTMEQRIAGFTLITQNVDGLHRRAGSHQVLELHGNLVRAKCFDEDRPVENWPDRSEESPPRCPRCGGLLRPDVVWFGEMLPPGAIDAAEQAARACDVLLVVGTSGAVWPAAGLAGIARRAGAEVVIVNPDASEIDDQAHWVLRGTAAGVLPALLGAG